MDYSLDQVTIGTLKSVSDVIDLSESLAQLPGAVAPLPAYRGQSRAHGSLLPSFARAFPKKSYGTAERIERKLIAEFREHFGRLSVLDKSLPQASIIGRGRDVRCLSVMQHYEVPTRLLDWTSSFWIAVYFACVGDPSKDAELWTYDRKIFELQRLERPMLKLFFDEQLEQGQEPVFLPHRTGSLIVEAEPRNSPRMEKQRAHHTIAQDIFGDHAPLLFGLSHESAAKLQRTPTFGRYILSERCKSRALSYLEEEEGITASSVFPDIVGVGRYLRAQFDALRTQLLDE